VTDQIYCRDAHTHRPRAHTHKVTSEPYKDQSQRKEIQSSFLLQTGHPIDSGRVLPAPIVRVLQMVQGAFQVFKLLQRVACQRQRRLPIARRFRPQTQRKFVAGRPCNHRVTKVHAAQHAISTLIVPDGQHLAQRRPVNFDENRVTVGPLVAVRLDGHQQQRPAHQLRCPEIVHCGCRCQQVNFARGQCSV
jgi:hypothetical protein